MELVFGWKSTKKTWPIKAFNIHEITPPLGIKVRDTIFALVFTSGYFGIHLIAWNWDFPSHTERIIWRVACLTLFGLLILYLLGVFVGTIFGPRFTNRFLNGNNVTTIPEMASLLPKWVALMM